ncbi:hypothetical protein CG740_23335 [Streptomyces sp. CB01201]|uniref:hypothetical protein n=1 Tax=Streptomyces sp. CB01201 TaxID=2020324 RepID=UPI000CAB3535|nr:hypothetical protein [Streptomyces sp. CB01201]PJN00839.1 hypothetical protein CG740_23335 [Streptomyces sp. CB01201]
MNPQSMRPMTIAEWEAAVTAADLLVGPSLGFRAVTGEWNAAVHIATGDQLTDENRSELIAELAKAVDDTVNRVLRTTTVRVSYGAAS